MKSKDQIAKEMYRDEYDNDVVFEDLYSGEKAAVTKRYNKQSRTPTAPRRSRGTVDTGITAIIGRPGVNGMQTCTVKTGATIQGLLDQAGITLDPDKEGVAIKNDPTGSISAGTPVLFTDTVIEGATYVVLPGINSQ